MLLQVVIFVEGSSDLCFLFDIRLFSPGFILMLDSTL